MGGKTSKDALKGARRRASLRAGALQVTGRYHHFPRKLEDDYILSETVLGCGCGGLWKDNTHTNILYCTYTYSELPRRISWLNHLFVSKMQEEHNLAGQIGAPDWLHSCRTVAVHRQFFQVFMEYHENSCCRLVSCATLSWESKLKLLQSGTPPAFNGIFC